MDDRVLVVATSNIGRAEIDAAIGGRFGNEAEVRVVAPASGLSKLQWLTNAEDDARADAGERAETVAEALPTENVDTEVGDSRPLQAITDALRTFPADQIVVVTRSADEATWLENDTAEAARERFAVPITHIVVG